MSTPLIDGRSHPLALRRIPPPRSDAARSPLIDRSRGFPQPDGGIGPNRGLATCRRPARSALVGSRPRIDDVARLGIPKDSVSQGGNHDRATFDVGCAGRATGRGDRGGGLGLEDPIRHHKAGADRGRDNGHHAEFPADDPRRRTQGGRCPGPGRGRQADDGPGRFHPGGLHRAPRARSGWRSSTASSPATSSSRRWAGSRRSWSTTCASSTGSGSSRRHRPGWNRSAPPMPR